jgi:hypothetical protein
MSSSTWMAFAVDSRPVNSGVRRLTHMKYKGNSMRRSNKSDRTVTCPSCMAPNRASESVCHECGNPLGTWTNLDPVQAIQTEGFLLHKSLKGRPKLIVLLGVWILHLPVLVVGIGAAIYMLFNLHGASELVFVLALGTLAYYAFIVLYRTTKNYLTVGRKT